MKNLKNELLFIALMAAGSCTITPGFAVSEPNLPEASNENFNSEIKNRTPF